MVADILDRFQLCQERSVPSQLSGGQQQLVALRAP